jgi:cob(I)alamin adenosyltransferase
MSIIHLSAVQDEPTAADLAAIEREWPQIAADLELLNAQIDLMNAGPFASVLDWRRVRRAERRMLDLAESFADRRAETEGVA